MAKRQQLAARRRVSGYTQEELAAELVIDASTVRRWERGRSTPQPWQQPRLCALLGITSAELLAMLDETVPSEEEDDPVDRRAFLADTTMVAAASALPPPPGSSAEIIDYLGDQLGGYYHADALIGPQRVLPTAVEQAATVQGLASAATGKDRQRLWRMSAAYAGLVTWLYQASGAMGDAHTWASRSIEMSHRGHDPQLTAHTLVNRAMLDTDQRDGSATIDLVKVVLDNQRTLCPKVRVQALQQAAHGYSLSGDRIRVDELLGEAAWLATRISDDYPWGNATRGVRYVDAQRATCYSRLRLGSEAVALWEDILADPRIPARDRPVFEIRYSSSLADARQPDHAMEILCKAIKSDSATSSRFRTEVEEAWHALKPWHRSAQGKEARQRLKDASLI